MAKRHQTASLRAIPAASLQAELKARRKLGERLLKKRDKLLVRANELNKQIAALGLSPGKPEGGKRFRNEQTLPEALTALLKGRTMSVSEAAEAVQKAGYRTTSSNFRTMVNIQLVNKDRFKKVSRGRYTSR